MTRRNLSFASPSRFSASQRVLLAAGVCAASLYGFAVPTQIVAQDQPAETFTLPTPTPSPTPAPQGPIDESVGVPIAPRVIPEQQSQESTSEPATPPATPQAPAPSPTATNAPAGTTQAPPGQIVPPSQTQPETDAPPSQLPAVSPVEPNVSNADARGARIAVDEAAGPGFESLADELEGTAPRSADGWYSVDEAGSEVASPVPSATPGAPDNANPILEGLSARSGVFAALLALMAVFAAMLGWVYSRRKRAAEGTLETPATVLTAGVRASMGEDAAANKEESTPEPEPAADNSENSHFTSAQPAEKEPTLPAPAQAVASTAPISTPVPTPPQRSSSSPAPSVTPAGPLKLDLSLDIINASRSLMRLSVEFSLEVTNRATIAARQINIAGELASAQEGATGPAPIDKTHAITTIDRLAPQQSRRVTGTLQLPMSEISAIRQNNTPVVIPLIHFRVGTQDHPAMKRTFVVGMPSASSITRVHPLMFDGPPGGLPPLRAQLIKQS
ncbi:hypothetical protein [uncultured Erythrobacter sp.]|uniref:hypothetical protein n=1 Tax=uncultured Erythrobacter sp. TaxID=263913 RepID=UPI002603A428|nr:hypothetical protein [uncultured Erythrobacter sp.]